MKSIKVGLGTCGVSAGGEKVYTALKEEIASKKIPVRLLETGCMGNCYQEVLVEVIDEAGLGNMYGNVTPDKVKRILDEQVLNDKPIREWIVKGTDAAAEDTFFAKQKRIVLRNCGIIDPNSIDEYTARGGYQAIQKVLNEYTPEQVIEIVLKSGLRGRGGAGFLTGMKWRFCRQAAGDKKYIICNADEGDPGAFMDRSTLESDPHSVLEGMMIGAYAIGADEAYIYVRAEYPMAVQRLYALHQTSGGKRVPGEEHIRLRDEPGNQDQGRGRCVRLRRRNGFDRLDRRQARHAATPSALPGPEGAVGQADQHQQRRDLRQRPLDHPQRRRSVRRHGHREQQGDKGLRPGRQDQARRAGRSPHGDDHQ